MFCVGPSLPRVRRHVCLPAGEADLADDLIDVAYDPFDHDRCVAVPYLFEELG